MGKILDSIKESFKQTAEEQKAKYKPGGKYNKTDDLGFEVKENNDDDYFQGDNIVDLEQDENGVWNDPNPTIQVPETPKEPEKKEVGKVTNTSMTDMINNIKDNIDLKKELAGSGSILPDSFVQNKSIESLPTTEATIEKSGEKEVGELPLEQQQAQKVVNKDDDDDDDELPKLDVSGMAISPLTPDSLLTPEQQKAKKEQWKQVAQEAKDKQPVTYNEMLPEIKDFNEEVFKDQSKLMKKAAQGKDIYNDAAGLVRKIDKAEAGHIGDLAKAGQTKYELKGPVEKPEVSEEGTIPMYFDPTTAPEGMQKDLTAEDLEKINAQLGEDKVEEINKAMDEFSETEEFKEGYDKNMSAIERGGQVDYNYNPTQIGKYEQAYNIGEKLRDVISGLGLTEEQEAQVYQDKEALEIAANMGELSILEYIKAKMDIDSKLADAKEKEIKEAAKRAEDREMVKNLVAERVSAAEAENKANKDKYNEAMTEWNKADKEQRNQLVADAQAKLDELVASGEGGAKDAIERYGNLKQYIKNLQMAGVNDEAAKAYNDWFNKEGVALRDKANEAYEAYQANPTPENKEAMDKANNDYDFEMALQNRDLVDELEWVDTEGLLNTLSKTDEWRLGPDFDNEVFLEDLKKYTEDPNSMSREEKANLMMAVSDLTTTSNLDMNALEKGLGDVKTLIDTVESAGRNSPDYVPAEQPEMAELNMDEFLTEQDLAKELGLDISGENTTFTNTDYEAMANEEAEALADLAGSGIFEDWSVEGGFRINDEVYTYSLSNDEFERVTAQFNEGYATAEELTKLNEVYAIAPDELVSNPSLVKDTTQMLDYTKGKYEEILNLQKQLEAAGQELSRKDKKELDYWKTVNSELNMKIGATAAEAALTAVGVYSREDTVDTPSNKVVADVMKVFDPEFAEETKKAIKYSRNERRVAKKTEKEMMKLAFKATTDAVSANPATVARMTNTQLAILATPAGCKQTIDSVVERPEALEGWKAGWEGLKTVIDEVGQLFGKQSGVEFLTDLAVTGQRTADRQQHAQAIEALFNNDIETFMKMSDKVISQYEVHANENNLEGTEKIRFYIEQAQAGVGLPGKIKDISQIVVGLGQFIGGGFIPALVPGVTVMGDGIKNVIKGVTNVTTPDGYTAEDNLRTLEKGLEDLNDIISPDVEEEIKKTVEENLTEESIEALRQLFDPNIKSTSTQEDTATNIVDETQKFKPGEGVNKVDEEELRMGFNKGLTGSTNTIVSDENLKHFIKRNASDPIVIGMYKRIK